MSKKKYRIKVRYTGRRFLKGRAWHRFERIDGSGGPALFPGVVGCVIGAVYYAGAKVIAKRPERCADEPIRSKPEWEAEDALADVELEKKRANSKLHAQNKAHLKLAIDVLRPLVQGLGYWETKTLVTYLAEQARPAGKTEVLRFDMDKLVARLNAATHSAEEK